MNIDYDSISLQTQMRCGNRFLHGRQPASSVSIPHRKGLDTSHLSYKHLTSGPMLLSISS
jgi:hypothetical protein